MILYRIFKIVRRKAGELLDPRNAQNGKQSHGKSMPILVLQYVFKHVVQNKAGIFASPRRSDLTDMHLLAECIYSAKFLEKEQANRLMDWVCGSVSADQAKAIKYDALLTDRKKTDNSSVIHNVAVISDAMSKKLEGQRHTPEKISFIYLRSTINDISKQVEWNKDNRCVVSPFKLMINKGKYYLLAFDGDSRLMKTYRVDRMHGLVRTGEAREGEDIFKMVDLNQYTGRVFMLHDGRKETVKLSFSNQALDRVIENFGTTGASYTKADDTHFIVEANVDICDRFFVWLLSFGEDVKIIESQAVVDEFTAYLDKIKEMY